MESTLHHNVGTHNFIEKFINPLFYAMVKGNHQKFIVGFLSIMIEDLQIAVYSWNPRYNITIPYWLRIIINPISSGFIVTKDALIILFAVSLSSLLMSLALMIYVSFSFSRGRFTRVWPLKVSRAFSTLLASTFFLPLFDVFIIFLNCTGKYETDESPALHILSSIQCFSGAHTPLFVLSLLSLCVFCPYALAIVLVHCDTEPSSQNRLAKINGRFDAKLFVIKIIMVLANELLSSAWSLSVIIFVLLYLLYTHGRQMAMYNRQINCIRGGNYFLAFSSCVISGIWYCTSTPGSQSSTPFIVLVSNAVPAWGIGYCISYYQLQRTQKLVYQRFQMKRAEKKKLKLEAKAKSELPPVSLNIIGNDDTARPVDQSVENLLEIVGRKKSKSLKVFQNEYQVEISCRFIYNNCQPDSVKIMKELFEEGLKQFPKCAFLRLTYENYLSSFASDDDKRSFNLIQKAKQMNPSFDTQFFIFLQERSLEQHRRERMLGKNNLNISSYVEFQSMAAEAKKFHIQTLQSLRLFWTYCRNDQISADVLTLLLQEVTDAAVPAEDYYSKLLARFPNSREILRLFAGFLSITVGNTPESQALLDLAETIDMQKAEIKLDEEDNDENAIETDMKDQEIIGNRKASTSSVPHSPSSLPYSAGNLTVPNNIPSNVMANIPEISKGERLAQAAKPHSTNEELIGVRNRITWSPENGVGGKKDVTDIAVTETKRFGNLEPMATAIVSHSHSQQANEACFPLPIDSPEPVRGSFRIDASEKSIRTPSESNGSSSTSSREQRLLRSFRNRIQSQLNQPVRSFKSRITFLGTAVIVMMVVSFTIILVVNKNITNEVEIQKTLGRTSRITAAIMLHHRQMYRCAILGDQTCLNRARENMEVMSDYLHNDVLPSISSLFQAPPISFVRVPIEDGTSIPVRMNIYDLTLSVARKAANVLSYNDSFFADDYLYRTNEDVRFLSGENINILGATQEDYSNSIDNDFQNRADLMSLILAVLLAAIVLLFIAIYIYCFHNMLNHTHEHQTKMLKLFKLLPKHFIVATITRLEEDIESLSEAAELNDRSIGTEKKFEVSSGKGSQKYKRQAFACVMLLTLACCSIFIVPMGALDRLSRLVHLITISNSQRYFITRTYTYVTELTETDNLFWSKDNSVCWLRQELMELQLNKETLFSRSSDLNLLSPFSEPKLFSLINDYHYNISVSSNETISGYGVFTFLDQYIDSINGFLTSSNWTLGSRYYQVVDAIHDPLSTVTLTNMAGYVDLANIWREESSSISIALFVLDLTLLLFANFVAFRRIMQYRSNEMRQIVNLLFCIPPNVTGSIKQFKQVIEHGLVQNDQD